MFFYTYNTHAIIFIHFEVFSHFALMHPVTSMYFIRISQHKVVHNCEMEGEGRSSFNTLAFSLISFQETKFPCVILKVVLFSLDLG